MKAWVLGISIITIMILQTASPVLLGASSQSSSQPTSLASSSLSDFTSRLNFDSVQLGRTPLASSACSGSSPAGVINTVQLNLTNTQGTSTPAPFQQMLTFDSSVFSQYEASDLSNVEFFTTSGSIIPSWLESGNNNAATNTIYWLKLPMSIPALSTLAICMGFGAVTTSFLNSASTGEAPQLSSTYAQYDDGVSVFNFYDNFAGTALSSKWTTSYQCGATTTTGPCSSDPNNFGNGLDNAQVSVGNGLTIRGPGGRVNGGIITTNTFSNPQYVDYDQLNYSYSGGSPVITVEQSVSNTFGFDRFDNGYASYVEHRSGIEGSYDKTNGGTVYHGSLYGLAQLGASRDSYGPGGAGILPAYGLPSVFSFSWLGTGAQTEMIDYGPSLTTPDANVGIGPLYLSVTDNGGSYSANATLQWIRLRSVPSNNVMPSCILRDPNGIAVECGGRQTSTSLACGTPIPMNGKTTCTVTVNGSPATGNVTFVDTGIGTYSTPNSQCTLSAGSCSITYFPCTNCVFTIWIRARYLGDPSNAASIGAFPIYVNLMTNTSTSVTCTSNPISVGSPVNCTASVSGSSPAGNVNWSVSGSNGGSATLSASSCTLSGGSCSVSITGESPGSVTLVAAYQGDGTNAGSQRALTLTVNPANPSVTVSVFCYPSPVNTGASTICVASVSQMAATGRMTFTSSSTTGTFSPSNGQCPVSSGACSLTYADSAAGTPLITATYSGDPIFDSASNSFRLAIVSAAPAPTAKVTLTAGSGGSISYYSLQGAGTVPAGTSLQLNIVKGNTLTLSAVPSTGNAFSTWSPTSEVDSGQNGQPVSLTSTSISPRINGDGTILAQLSTVLTPTTLLLTVDPPLIPTAPGITATVTATLLDQYGHRLSGVSVTFQTSLGKLLRGSDTTNPRGEATTTLVPNFSTSTPQPATVTATTATLTTPDSISFIPFQTTPSCANQVWQNCNAFYVSSVSYTVPQFALPFSLIPLVGAAAVPLLNPALDGYRIQLYSISPTCSTSDCETSFATNLNYFFNNLAAPDGYNPQSMMLISIPLIPIIDTAYCYHVFSVTLGCLNLAPNNNGVPWGFGNQQLTYGLSPSIQLTPNGNLNLAETFSRNTDPYAIASQTTISIANLIIGLVGSLFKDSDNPDAVAAALNLISSEFSFAASVADIRINDVTSELSQVGPFKNFVVFDFDDFAGAVSFALGAITSLMTHFKRWMDLFGDATHTVLNTLIQNYPGVIISFGKSLLDGLNLLVQGVASLPSEQSNTFLQQVAVALNGLTTIVDPNNSTIVPSYNDAAGRLLLGYNATSNSMIYVSSSGLLIATNDTYTAYLFGAGNVTVVLNTVGTHGTPVPYVTSAYNMTIGSVGAVYAGVLPVGQTQPVNVTTSQSGTIMPTLSVSPSVYRSNNQIFMIPYLSNGTKIGAIGAIVSVGNRTFTMTQVNSTLFSLNLNSTFESNPLSIYATVNGYPGGHSIAYAPSSTTTIQPINDATGNPPSGTEAAGASFHDSATISGVVTITGATGITPTGIVTYEFFGDSICAGIPTAQNVTLTLTGSLPASSMTGPLASGQFSFQAIYQGDSNYLASTSACTPFSVLRTTPSIMSQASSPAIQVSNATSDLATISNGFSPSGSVTYSIYNDTACTNRVFQSAAPLGSPSLSFHPNMTGTYQWVANYTGDTNNNSVVTSCGADPVLVTSGPVGGTVLPTDRVSLFAPLSFVAAILCLIATAAISMRSRSRRI